MGFVKPKTEKDYNQTLLHQGYGGNLSISVLCTRIDVPESLARRLF